MFSGLPHNGKTLFFSGDEDCIDGARIKLCTFCILGAAGHREEVATDLNSAARFSSLTVTDGVGDAAHSTGCNGYCATGGLAWDGESAARILSAGVIDQPVGREAPGEHASFHRAFIVF